MKRKPLFIVIACATFAFVPLSYSPEVLAQAAAVQPRDGWYKQLVEFATVKANTEMPKGEMTAILVDSRPTRLFDAGHIPTAISIPDSQFDKLAPTKLPADKATPIIFYCQGHECTLSHQSAFKAEALGYTNIRVYPAGYPEWQARMGATTPAATMVQAAQGVASAMAQAAGAVAGSAVAIAIEAGKEKGSISTASFERILKENPSQIAVIDVRDEKDVKKGTFPGAINIPLNELEKKLGSLPKDKPVVFTCATGARSGEAYDTVKMLAGDIKAYFLDADVSCDGSMCKLKPH